MTQSLFQSGNLICLGDAEEYIDIIRNNKVAKSGTESLNEFIQSNPELLKSIMIEPEVILNQE